MDTPRPRGLAQVLPCPASRLLVDGWVDHPDRQGGLVGLPASLYRCPPCRARLVSPWLVSLGYHRAVVRAGCAEAASMMAWRAFARHGRDDPALVLYQWQRLQGPQRARITARRATPAEVAAFDRMVWEADHRKDLDTTR